jgi:hypothetical protein
MEVILVRSSKSGSIVILVMVIGIVKNNNEDNGSNVIDSVIG